jgi:hypothetical protein
MKKWLATILCSGVLLSGGAAFADEMAKDSMGKHEQMMKDCMARQDASKGKEAAMKACKEMLDKGSMSKDGMSKDGMSKDGMSKDASMSHDKESMPK